MIKTRLWPVIALGLIAGLVRAFGPTSFAEIAAIGYLVTATVMFGRPWLVTDHLMHPVSIGRRLLPK